MCDSGTESDLESYSSVPPREIFGPHDDHLFPHDDFDTHFIEIDPRNLSYRSSTDVNTTSSRTSSSCETRHGGGGGTSSKPHKAHDCGWDAIRTVTSRDGDVGLNHFRFVQRLGSGDVGCVYLAELRGTSCYFAMKVMDKRALSGRNKLLRAQTEKEILEALDHPFLPTLYAHMDEKQFSCLVMEFCSGGDLHILRQRQPLKCFTEDAVRFYAAEVLLALEYLHMMGIVYRDLKPENVLVRDDGHIMLSDFDLSLKCNVNPVLSRIPSVPHNPSSCLLPGLRCVAPCNIHPAASCLPLAKWKLSSSSHRRSPLPELVAEPTNIRSMSFVGTHEYLAPEIVVGDGHGSSVDWWTFGIFLFELLFGRTPFKGPDNEHTLMNIITQPLRFPVAASPSPSSNPSSPSPAAIDIIRSLLIKHPHKRLGAIRGASEIKHHPFFENLNWALIRCSVPPHIPISPCTTPHPSQPPSSLQSPWIMQGNPSDSFADFMFF